MMYKKLSNNPYYRASNLPPWAFYDDVFTLQELNSISKICSSLDLNDASVIVNNNKSEKTEESLNSDVRRSKTGFISFTNEYSWIFDRFNSVIESMNDNFFNYDLNGYDFIQYSEYHANNMGEYNYHNDMILLNQNNGQFRKLSLTILLNDEFEGGEFYINLASESEASIVPTRKNRIILFPSYIIHRVAPVTWGIRKSLVIWAVGPKFR